MYILVILIVLLGIVSALAGLLRHKKLKEKILRGELDAMPEIHQVTDCGADECSLETTGTCEQSCTRHKVRLDYEYFDDEELDRYKGCLSDSYSDEQIEEFREILYTMEPSEVEDWTASLACRGIELPDAIKDEVFMIIEDKKKG